MLKRYKVAVLSTALSALPLVAFAQYSSACDVFRATLQIVRIFGSVVFVAAVAVLLWSGFLFITQSGSEEGTTKAKTYLIYALIGIAVALLATSARPIIGAIFPNSQLVAGCGTEVVQ